MKHYTIGNMKQRKNGDQNKKTSLFVKPEQYNIRRLFYYFVILLHSRITNNK